MAEQPAIVFASFRPHPEKASELLETLEVMMENTRNEPGNERYDLYRSVDGETFHLFERYTDAAALDAHRAAQYYLDYRAKLPDLLADAIDVKVLSEVDVQG
jgi:quinol monooxygenase YgiN